MSRLRHTAQMDGHAKKTSKELLRNANRLNSKLQVNLQQETKTIDKMVEFIEKERLEISNTRKAIAAEITTNRRAHILSRIGDHYDSDSDQEGVDLCQVSVALKHSKHLFNTVLDKAKGFCVSRSQIVPNGKFNELKRGNETANHSLPLIMVKDEAKTSPADFSSHEEIDVSEKVRRYIEQLEPAIATSEIESELQEKGKREDSPKVRSEPGAEVVSEFRPERSEVGSEFRQGVMSEFRPGIGSECGSEIGPGKCITSFSGSGVKPQTAPSNGTCKDTVQQGRRSGFRRLAVNKMAANMNNENVQNTVNNYNLSPRNSDLNEERNSPPVQPTKIRNRRHSVLGIAINVPIISEPILSKRRNASVTATVEENSSTEIHLNYGQEKQRLDSPRTHKRLSRSQHFNDRITKSNSIVKPKTTRSVSDNTQFRNKSEAEGSHTPDINLSRKLGVPRQVSRRYSLPPLSRVAAQNP